MIHAVAELPQIEIETGPQRPPIPENERAQRAALTAVLHLSNVSHGVEMVREEVLR